MMSNIEKIIFTLVISPLVLMMVTLPLTVFYYPTLLLIIIGGIAPICWGIALLLILLYFLGIIKI